MSIISIMSGHGSRWPRPWRCAVLLTLPLLITAMDPDQTPGKGSMKRGPSLDLDEFINAHLGSTDQQQPQHEQEHQHHHHHQHQLGHQGLDEDFNAMLQKPALGPGSGPHSPRSPRSGKPGDEPAKLDRHDSKGSHNSLDDFINSMIGGMEKTSLDSHHSSPPPEAAPPSQTAPRRRIRRQQPERFMEATADELEPHVRERFPARRHRLLHGSEPPKDLFHQEVSAESMLDFHRSLQPESTEEGIRKADIAVAEEHGHHARLPDFAEYYMRRYYPGFPYIPTGTYGEHGDVGARDTKRAASQQ